LDPSSAEAHQGLGFTAFYYDWNVPEALAEMRRSVELGHLPEQRAAYGWTLCQSGRIDEGLPELDAAVAVDPLSPSLPVYREWSLYVNGRHREVLAEHQRALRLKIAS